MCSTTSSRIRPRWTSKQLPDGSPFPGSSSRHQRRVGRIQRGRAPDGTSSENPRSAGRGWRPTFGATHPWRSGTPEIDTVSTPPSSGSHPTLAEPEAGGGSPRHVRRICVVPGPTGNRPATPKGWRPRRDADPGLSYKEAGEAVSHEIGSESPVIPDVVTAATSQASIGRLPPISRPILSPPCAHQPPASSREA